MDFKILHLTKVLVALTLGVAMMMSPLSHAYQTYKDQIPNGNRVRHPCLPFLKWPGVGHTNPFGAGNRNPFGKDFAFYGYQWTTGLCNRDSDGDGRTNGEELGDPDCEWTIGDTPSRRWRITHPGYKPFDIVGCFSLSRISN